MIEYITDSFAWAFLWFVIGCIVGFIYRGIRDARPNGEGRS